MEDYIKLFEIPIYSFDKSAFQKRWSRRFKKESHTHAVNFEEDKYRENYKNELKNRYTLYWNKISWEYNQIVGYLIIGKLGPDICLIPYLPQNNFGEIINIRYDWSKKLFINKLPLEPKHHFPISRYPDSNSLKCEIIKLLETGKEVYAPEPKYIDISYTINLIENIDIFAYINKLENIK